ncbi:MAG: Ig-like domain-containing protein, partial [Planctomycetota bacterium]|nr:Ig-like domain-containing protein [Planctomycetota bacterium]
MRHATFARRLRCEPLEDRRMLSIASFETGLDGWIQSTDDDGDWRRRSGGTPSANTGPSAAYSGSYYLFTDASSFQGSLGSPNKSAYLDKTVDLSTFDNLDLRFYYHMYGDSMGTLYVDVNDGSGWDSDVWHITGQQHTSYSDPWTLATVDLSTYAGESAVTIRLRGVTGSSIYSDMAIDNVELVTIETDPPTVTSLIPASGQTITSSSVDIDVTFSEEVRGVDATDLVLSNTAAAFASVGTPIDQGGNTWRFPVAGLIGGTLDVSLAPDTDDIENLAGNDLDPSPTQWTYSVTGSAVPTVVDLVAASDTGTSDSDDLTNLDNSTAAKALQFEVSGTIPGATVTVYSDGIAIGSALADSTTTIVTSHGSYDLADGSRAITARQIEPGKAGSDNTEAISVTIDTVASWQIDNISTKLLADDGAVEDWFGESVSISGTMAIVGANGDDDNGTYSGSAYIFEETASGWEQVAKLTADDGATYDYFGISVSISGTTAIVGAHGDDDNG